MPIDQVFKIFPLSLLLIFFGAFTLIFKKKYGIIFILAGLLLVYLFSLFPVAGLLLRPLQKHYTPYINPPGSPRVEYIVVLGGWHKTNDSIPLSSQLGYDSLTRIIEAISLYHKNPGSRLILSGAQPDNDPVTNAEMMERMAVSLNVPLKDIILENRPKNTAEEAVMLKEKLLGKIFILVTSAAHMQRAMHLFHAHNLNPIPAPVNFLLLKHTPFSLEPSAIALQTSETAMHEHIGLLWAWLKEQMDR
jgi:uncharacterized SAM-binding protein YcdF (DUF218 family)